MYEFEIEEKLRKKFSKLSKKDPKKLRIIKKKILEIIIFPHHYKNLRNDMKKFKRVHVDKHFILIFEVDEGNELIVFHDFDHHDKIYR